MKAIFAVCFAVLIFGASEGRAHIADKNHDGQAYPKSMERFDCGMTEIMESAWEWASIVAEGRDDIFEEPVSAAPVLEGVKVSGRWLMWPRGQDIDEPDLKLPNGDPKGRIAIGEGVAFDVAKWKIENQDEEWSIPDFSVIYNEYGCDIGHVHHGGASSTFGPARLSRAERVFYFAMKQSKLERAKTVLLFRVVSIWQKVLREQNLKDGARSELDLKWKTESPPYYHDNCGVYVIRDGKSGAVLRVGQSKKLHDRIPDHEDRRPDSVVYWANTPHCVQMNGVERFLGDHYRPQDSHPRTAPIKVNLPF